MRELPKLPPLCFRPCRNQQRIEAYLHARGIELNVVFHSDDNMTVQAMVAAGVGIALVPRLSMLPAGPDITLIGLDARLPPRVLGIVWHRDRFQPPATSAFIQASVQVCAELQGCLSS